MRARGEVFSMHYFFNCINHRHIAFPRTDTPGTRELVCSFAAQSSLGLIRFTSGNLFQFRPLIERGDHEEPEKRHSS